MKLLSKRLGYLYFCLIGFLFVFCFKTGKNLAEWGNILWDTQYTLTTLGISLLGGLVLGAAVCLGIYRSARGSLGSRAIGVSLQRIWNRIGAKLAPLWSKVSLLIGKLSGGKLYGLSLFLILLSWLPTYLAYYPGICSYDTPIQTGQIVDDTYVDHHPILHTLLIREAMELGESVFGDVNSGIAVYTALQMLLLAAAMSYGILLLHRFRVNVVRQLVVQLFCMCYPFHWFMSVSMTKDTVFSSFVLLFLLSMTVLLLQGRNSLRVGGQDVVLIIGALGIVFFRNNGRYALLVPLVFLLFMVWRGRKARKLWTRLLICCGGAFLVGNLGLQVLFEATDAQQGDRREMLSMPIQQLARCMIYHGGVGVLSEDDNTMADGHKALIEDFILNEAYKLYHPAISDPVKKNTNTYVVRYRAGEFVRTYVELLTQYPGDFINAALAVNAGFLYPGDISHAYINVSEGSRNMGYVQTNWVEEELNPRGIYKASKWPWLHERLEKWTEDNAYLQIPLLKYFFIPGVFLWCYLILLGYLLIHCKLRMWLPISFVAGYYLTMFLGPTVQLRYIYPVMVALPYLILLCCNKNQCEDSEYEG